LDIALSRLHFPVTTLGPGQRVGIWFQGCKIRCPGCVSIDTWAEGKGVTVVSEVLVALAPWLEQADGITISGGEPFDQPEALECLLRGVSRTSVQDVLVYSGYPFELLADLPIVSSGLIDALITDPFVVEAPQTLPLRGSDNQRLHLLTDLGRRNFAQFQTSSPTPKPSLDVMFDADGTVWIAGIPKPGDLHRLRDLLGHQGHEIRTTAAPTRPN
jgi:anaerobic ribonucleoside-triphosphate reductase activating protein